MFAQVVTFEEQPDEVEAGIRHVEEEVLPALRDAQGLRGAWLVDREKGRRLSIMVWDREADAETAMARVQQMRGDGPRPTPASVDRYEVYATV